MNILLSSHAFAPSIGGIETMSLTLATEFVRQGHVVKVVTQTPGETPNDAPFTVVRRPSPKELFALVRWCHVYFHNNISLQTIWPLAFLRRRWVVTHQTWLTRIDGRLGWQDRAKLFLLRFATNISISEEIAQHIPVESTIIGNCFNEEEFFVVKEVARSKDLVFLGRLVSDKGVDILLEALAVLKLRGLQPQLTIIGKGSEDSTLRQRSRDLGIQSQVDFVGPQTGATLRNLLNQHRIMVVPSLWREPFGVVALEGIACGCVVVGSQGGGLRDAIGPCGATFPNGSIDDLAHTLATLLNRPQDLLKYRENAKGHLEKHTARYVASEYLKIFAGR